MADFIKKACLLWACLSFSCAYGKILKDDVVVKSESFHSFSQVCKKLVNRESPLIEAFSINKLDCMGEVVEVATFCQKERSHDPYFSRGFIDSKNKKVVCQSASRVSLSYLCQNGAGEICQDKDIGCYMLKEKFAHGLRVELASFGAVEKNGNKKLNCHFAAGNNQEIFKLNL